MSTSSACSCLSHGAYLCKQAATIMDYVQAALTSYCAPLRHRDPGHAVDSRYQTRPSDCCRYVTSISFWGWVARGSPALRYVALSPDAKDMAETSIGHCGHGLYGVIVTLWSLADPAAAVSPNWRDRLSRLSIQRSTTTIVSKPSYGHRRFAVFSHSTSSSGKSSPMRAQCPSGSSQVMLLAYESSSSSWLPGI